MKESEIFAKAAVVFALAIAGAAVYSWTRSHVTSISDNVAHLEKVRTLEIPNQPDVMRIATGVSWSPDSHILASYSRLGSQVVFWTSDGIYLKKLELNRNQYTGRTIGFLAGGKQILTARDFSKKNPNVAFAVRDLKTEKIVRDIDGPLPDGHAKYSRPSDYAVSTDGRFAASMTGLLDDAVTLYSTEDWRVLRRISVTEPSAPRIVYRSLFNPDQHPAQPPPDTAMSVAFSHDGKFLAIGRISGTVLIIDLSAASAAPTMIEVYKVGNSSSVCALGFSPDGRFLGTGSGLRSDGLTRETESAEKAQENAPIKIWNMADHTLFASYPDRKVAAITQLSWSADSLFLAAGGDRTVRIFAPTNPTHEASVIKFDAPVLSVSFAPAGRSLAIAAGSAITIFSVRP